MTTNKAYIDLEARYLAQNYQPLPVVLSRAQGVYAWDVQGRRYLDMMSAYSAVAHGHCHPRLVQALVNQAQQLGVTSRAYHNDKLGAFCQLACQLTQQERALPMNTGAEAVETAIKAARKWAYTVKGVPTDKAEIIVCDNNFHGRTVTITSFSTEPQYRAGFGPFTPGFKSVPFGDADALLQAITPNTAAFLVEPIQGEAGIQVPPLGYLQTCQQICNAHNVLLICDEIQTGLGRTGKFLASQHEAVHADGIVLGKALGGGLLPVSLFLAKREVMDVFTPGDHGSTFGGNPLACAVGLESLQVIQDEGLVANAMALGEQFMTKLKTLRSPKIKTVRGKGLFIGVELNPEYADAHAVVLALAAVGLLSKDTHETVVRLAPPLIINQTQLDSAFTLLASVLD
jgi:ornithine--oxo-acid transaminase